ncbi:MAG TPA: periplasmic heavy metal sensor [Pyrinomonadaceae bacterium]|jgi:Spy/CpxP family protein refolding chaperone|nr:periplasmic heavy metal sensor [Pyrinomonadaceae bacterium]
MRLRTLMLFLAIVLLFTGASSSYAQEPEAPGGDPIQQLRLTPEQRQRIRQIFAENKDDRQTTNRKLREANFALEQALDAEPVNENVIEQRINDLAAAQAAQTRMRIRMELKIRRELRPEQLAIWRTLRLQLKDFAGAQRPGDDRPAGQNLRPNRRPNANTLRPRP